MSGYAPLGRFVRPQSGNTSYQSGDLGMPETNHRPNVGPVSSHPAQAAPAGAHSEAVAALREQYSAIPTGSPVRLAKPTSNLFRFRQDQAGRGPGAPPPPGPPRAPPAPPPPRPGG